MDIATREGCLNQTFICLASAAEFERKSERANANWWRSRASMWFRRAAKYEGNSQ